MKHYKIISLTNKVTISRLALRYTSASLTNWGWKRSSLKPRTVHRNNSTPTSDRSS